MENQDLYLPKDILGTLCLRVAKTLPCIKFLEPATIWSKPIEFCLRIEGNVREVDNVILEVTRENSYFQNNSANPRNYHLMLARVYILLYYRHCDDEVYKVVVFPELQKHMGLYCEKHLNDIQSKVENVRKMDALVAKSNAAKRPQQDAESPTRGGHDNKDGFEMGHAYCSKADVERLISDKNRLLQQLQKLMKSREAELSALHVRVQNTAQEPSAPSSAETQRLEEENSRLRSELADAEKEICCLKDEMKEQKQEISRMQDSLHEQDEIFISLLSTLFMKDEGRGTAEAFFNDLQGKDDAGVADVVIAYRKKFSPKMQRIILWNILSTAKLYGSTDSNLGRALRQRGWS